MNVTVVDCVLGLLSEYVIAKFAPRERRRPDRVSSVRFITEPGDIPECQDAIAVYLTPHDESVWDTLTELRTGGVALVLLGGDPPDQTRVEQWSSERDSPTLAWVHKNVDWADVIALSRSMISGGPAGSTMGIPVGDLFDLVNTISSLVGGATGIVDVAGRILAYSTNRDQKIDEVRRRTTLTLVEDQSPDEDPVYAQIYAHRGPLVLELSAEASYPRVAMAVRLRGEILATVWTVAVDPPSHDKVCQVLHALEPVIAQHLSRALLVNRAEIERTSELLRTVLEVPTADTASARLLGLSPNAKRAVLRFAFYEKFVPNQLQDLRRLLYIVDSHARLIFSRVVVALIGVQVVALVDLREGNTLEDLKVFARRTINNEATAETCPIIVGISNTTVGVAALHTANMQALDTISAMEGSQPGGTGTVGVYHDWRSVIRLAYMTDVVRNSWLWVDDEIAEILAYDRHHNTELLPTLISFFRENSNVSKTADNLMIHKNTVRYRIKRIEEAFDVDLDDHHLRLWMWLRMETLRFDK